MTGSITLQSDALESTVKVATALEAIVAIRVAARPADANHPYGHHIAVMGTGSTAYTLANTIDLGGRMFGTDF